MAVSRMYRLLLFPDCPVLASPVLSRPLQSSCSLSSSASMETCIKLQESTISPFGAPSSQWSLSHPSGTPHRSLRLFHLLHCVLQI
ncbi:hypothetical protein FB45DRAFT_891721, partial [Roridomyces roridus]